MAKLRFSAEWTAEERLLLVIVMTDLIRDDVNAGCYSAIGRPNVQSVHEMIIASKETLEEHREDIAKMLKDWSRGDNAKRVTGKDVPAGTLDTPKGKNPRRRTRRVKKTKTRRK